MKRTAAVVILTGAAWMGLSGEARAQSLITPMGPMAVRPAPITILSLESEGEKLYPGRTMGGGTRILRSSPPPSFLKRRKE